MREKNVITYNLQNRTIEKKLGNALEVVDGSISCVLMGVIFECANVSSSLKELITLFRQQRSRQVLMEWGCRTQGNFALILIDGENGQFHCVTDRVNSRKIFVQRHPDHLVLADTILVGAGEPDLHGLGSYLSNSGTFGGRTLFKNVRTVDRASVFSINSESESSTRYWDLKFDASYANRKTSSLIDEFYDVIESACLRETSQDTPLRLLLSAGYDSSFLLGILAKKRRGQLTAFSYSLKTDLEPGYDAYTARLMAEQLGMPFQVVRSYNANLMDVLSRAATFTQCLTFINEPDAYVNMQSDQEVRYLTGDECLGWGNFPVRTKEEAANAIGFYNGAALGRYTQAFGNELASLMSTGCAELLHKTLESAPDLHDLHDLKDWLYLDQRENFFVLGSRPYCLGQNWATPLLDSKVLEFVAKLPSSRRIGKKLFKQTAHKVFPDLYKLPRAYTGGVSADWKQELITNKVLLLDWIKHTHCSLDDILPANCWEDLFAMQHARPAPTSIKQTIKQNLVRYIRGSRIGNAILSTVPGLASLGPRYLYSYAAASQISPTMMLMKLLIARHLFIETARCHHTEN